jgi:preprotein translocase subunit SecG
MGVRKTTDFLEKTTWSLAIALLVLSILASATIPRHEVSVERSRLENVDFSDPGSTQSFPTMVPEQTTAPVEQPATEE